MNPQVITLPSAVSNRDPLLPTIPVKLDRERNLLVNFNALAMLEERTGRSVMIQESWQSMKLGDVRLMLFAALQHEDPELTERQVGKLLNMGNLPYVVGQVSQAWKMSVAGDEEDEDPQPGEMRERFRSLEIKKAA